MSAQLFDSVPPDVKYISLVFAFSDFAIVFLESSSAFFDAKIDAIRNSYADFDKREAAGEILSEADMKRPMFLKHLMDVQDEMIEEHFKWKIERMDDE